MVARDLYDSDLENGSTHKPNKTLRRIATRGSVFHATSDHIVFASTGAEIIERPAGEVKTGDTLTLVPLPAPTGAMSVTEDEAWLLGILASEGFVSPEGKVTVTNQDQALLDNVASCWTRVCGGTSSTYLAPSGFANGRESTQLRLTGARAYGRYLREQLYTRSSNKRIPKRVLNASAEAQLAFLRGFNAGDGLKSTPCTYEFQGFKSSSAIIAAGSLLAGCHDAQPARHHLPRVTRRLGRRTPLLSGQPQFTKYTW